MTKTNKYDAQEAFRSAVDKLVNTLVVLMLIALAALAVSSFMSVPIAKGDDCPNGVCPQRYAPSNTVVPSRARAPEPFYSNYPRFRYWNNPYIKIQPQKNGTNNKTKPKSNGRYRKVSHQDVAPGNETIVVKRVDFITTHTVNVLEITPHGVVPVDTATVHTTQNLVNGKLENLCTYDCKSEIVFRGKEWWLISDGVIVISPGRVVTETATIRKTGVKQKTKTKDA